MKLLSIDQSVITIVPVLHGKIAFAEYVRECCMKDRFDCITIDLPQPFEPYLAQAIDDLPYISAIVAQAGSDPVYYVPIDPCDAAIEATRQARQNHVPFFCIGHPALCAPLALPPLPDENAIKRIGFDEYATLCLHAVGNAAPGSQRDTAGQYIAHRLHQLRSSHKNILALVHMGNCARAIYHFNQEKTHNLSFPIAPQYTIRREFINPDHLYFALGELPFVTGKFEKERYDPFAEKIDVVELIKDLFRETRDHFHENRDQALDLSPGRVQRALAFLRNLTVSDDRLVPSLFDIVVAAKGVGGNSYALHMLKCARYYPYLPVEMSGPFLSVGIDKIVLPDESSAHTAVNFLRDFSFVWQYLSIKPDPTDLQKKKYRYSWDPGGMCSHVPEDERIEKFNDHVRNKALSMLREDLVVSEKFTVSVRDGIDIRETLTKWYTGDIYVKELPPSRGAMDTVVILFDSDHDELYPHKATWFAEHDQESTLTFYSTDPFDNMIGPGVARSQYGGLCLLYPPRAVPNIFEIPTNIEFKSNAECLTYGALLFSEERRIAFVAKNKPGVRLRKMAESLKKHIVWVPLSTFSSETLKKLRTFHVLNGKHVRSWAARFIGE